MVRGRVRIGLAGRHNVQNALAVVAVADHLGVPFDAIAAAFESFAGTQRRGETLGTAAGVTVVSDYAHHPTAIRSRWRRTARAPACASCGPCGSRTPMAAARLAADFTWSFGRPIMSW